jgi:hypothetical protein
MGGSDEEKFDHPTQKPVDLMRRPILNHIKRGALVYEPFHIDLAETGFHPQLAEHRQESFL